MGEQFTGYNQAYDTDLERRRWDEHLANHPEIGTRLTHREEDLPLTLEEVDQSIAVIDDTIAKFNGGSNTTEH